MALLCMRHCTHPGYMARHDVHNPRPGRPEARPEARTQARAHPHAKVHAAVRPTGAIPLMVERFSADPGEWLPSPATPKGRHRWEIELSVAGAHRRVIAEIGDVWRVGDALWRSCSWWPLEEQGDWVEGPKMLPTFHGSLGLSGGLGSRLVLSGSYDPPLGALGRFLDKVLLGRLAGRSALGMLEQLAQRLTRQT